MRRSSSALSSLVAACLFVGCGGGTPGTDQPQADHAERQAILADDTSGFTCQADAITCVQVSATGTTPQDKAPITFGQAFRAGDVPEGTQLVARDEAGRAWPMQMDAVSRRADGSVRFAVLSVALGALAAGERRVVNFYPARTTQPSAPPPDAGAYDLQLNMRLYQPQMTLVSFGNPQGWADGAPFRAGETVTLDLDGEVHTVAITADLAGGGLNNLLKLAQAFLNKINQDSTRFKAHKIGDAGAWNHLWLSTRQPDGGAFTVSGRVTPGSAATLTVANKVAYAPPRMLRASAASALRTAVSTGQAMHLRGAVANEYTLVLPFQDSSTQLAHPQLTARLHVRLLDGGTRARTDVVIENNWAYNPNPGNHSYELSATSAGQTVLTQALLHHTHHARWHRVLWQGPQVLANVRHHMPYLMASRVVWNYQLKLDVPEALLQKEATRLAGANTQPMGSAFLMPYFPTTGGREEIGPYPRWTALYLVTQDERARRSMLANADAAAGVPIHYRDAATDEVLDIDTHPTAATWLGYNSGELADRFPALVDTGTIWTPDVAHQGSFAFVPYLVTGDKFYLDEMMFWAGWNLSAMHPQYRGSRSDKASSKYLPDARTASGRAESVGLLDEQIRGRAWGLRSLGEVARVAPDTHPLKAYFDARVHNNIQWHLRQYTTGQASPMGIVDKPDDRNISGLWQNDMLGIVFSQLVENDHEQARPVLDWLNRFNVGRFLHEADGYCLYRAAGNYIRIRHADGQYIQTWRDLFQANYTDTSCASGVDPNSYPDSPSAYAGYARAMLAAAHNAGAANALSAYQTWVARTPLIDRNLATQDPTWALVPR